MTLNVNHDHRNRSCLTFNAYANSCTNQAGNNLDHKNSKAHYYYDAIITGLLSSQVKKPWPHKHILYSKLHNAISYCFLKRNLYQFFSNPCSTTAHTLHYPGDMLFCW